ncbi:MAG: glycoside hydrolase family 30 protein [Bacteroidales bacterium]
MKKTIQILFFTFLFWTIFNVFSKANAGEIKIVSTSYEDPWQEVQDYKSSTKNIENAVMVNTQTKYQQIDGFGASFNELGWKALSYIEPGAREKIMKDIFDPVNGLRFNICRMSIGSNDFSRGYYSLNDHHYDYKMEHFTIERDKQTIIPYIKMAMQYNPDLKVWGSPWTPPTWMKQSGHYGGKTINDNWGQILGAPMEDIEPLNRIKNDEKTLEAYATYFVKYIESYRKKGVNVYAIHPQNEIFANQIFPSCLWEAQVMEDFLANHLIPEINKMEEPAEIWLGTINKDTLDFVNQIMENPVIAENIKGFGLQWAGKHMVDTLSKVYDNYKLMQTESECNNGSNDWITAMHTYGLLMKYLKGGVNSYLYWNLILDELGLSNWVWRQNSMVSINKFTKEVVYNPEFYIMKHFSHFADPGAHRIELEGGQYNDIAFENPDGSIIIITANDTADQMERTFSVDGKTVSFTAEQGKVYTIEIVD